MAATLEKSRDKTVIPLKVSAEIVRKLANDSLRVERKGLKGRGRQKGGKSRDAGIAIARTVTRDLLNYDRCSVWPDLASRVHPSGISAANRTDAPLSCARPAPPPLVLIIPDAIGDTSAIQHARSVRYARSEQLLTHPSHCSRQRLGVKLQTALSRLINLLVNHRRRCSFTRPFIRRWNTGVAL